MPTLHWAVTQPYIFSHFPGIYQFSVPESSKSGTPVGRIRAADKDVGKNAEMYFTIVSGDGLDTFDIFTDKATQEGVITVSKVRLGMWSSLMTILWILIAFAWLFMTVENYIHMQWCFHTLKARNVNLFRYAMFCFFFTLLTDSSNFTQQLKLSKILKTFFKMSLLLKCYSWRGIIRTPPQLFPFEIESCTVVWCLCMFRRWLISILKVACWIYISDI